MKLVIILLAFSISASCVEERRMIGGNRESNAPNEEGLQNRDARGTIGGNQVNNGVNSGGIHNRGVRESLSDNQENNEGGMRNRVARGCSRVYSGRCVD